jgi:hypothetical protein
MLSLVLMCWRFYILAQQTKNQIRKKINAEKSTISSKPKSETADSMTSNQIVAKVKQFYNQK